MSLDCVTLTVSRRHKSPYLSHHLGEVVDVGGAQGLGLEALQLQVVLGDVGRAQQQVVEETLLAAVRLELHLHSRGQRSGRHRMVELVWVVIAV